MNERTRPHPLGLDDIEARLTLSVDEVASVLRLGRTAAYEAARRGEVISDRLGHENPAFTLKQYAHVFPGMQAEAAELVAELELVPRTQSVRPPEQNTDEGTELGIGSEKG